MADERIITELIVQGAQESVQNILTVQRAITALTTQIVSTERIRTPQLEGSLQNIAGLINQLGSSGAKNVQQLAQAFVDLAAKLEASRVRTAQLHQDLAELQRTAGNLRQFSTPNNLGGPIQGPTQNPQRLQVAADAAAFTATRNAIVAQQAAAQTLQGRLVALVATITATVAANLRLGQSATQTATAITAQGEAADRTQKRGVTYLSVLSAIHAASFLASNQTFTLLGSFTTLGLAFGKAGAAALVLGVTLGGLLAVFGQVAQAAKLIQDTVVGLAETLVKVGVGITAALLGTGAASVKTAADVETQLASVRAFGNATVEQVKAAEQQAVELSERFGVAASDVLQATSLFARAGGSIEDALKGATEAIIQLQVASAGELSAAQAAIFLSAALKQFSLDGTHAVRVADNLAAAFQSSALSAVGVQQAFIQAAPGAAALGISIETLSAAIALLGDQLIKGTTTGTAFKQFILDVVNPTDKAQKALGAYGVSFKDANDNALPFLDALRELNKGLGDSVIGNTEAATAARATALTVAFGARAYLAANILTRQGTQGLQDYADELEKVTASNITNVLLLPLTKQLERLGVVVRNLATSFGGPLLGPVREAVVQITTLFSGLKPIAELFGQTISSVVANQGFGALKEKIDALVSDDILNAFFLNIINTAANVRDVIVTQIIPAIQTFILTLSGVASEEGRVDQIGQAFNRLNGFIQSMAASIATAIVQFGKLVVEIVNNEGRGRELRDTVANLANAFLTQLTASIITTTTAIAAAIAVMPILARIALLTAQTVLKLSGAFKEVGLKAIDLGLQFKRMEIGLKISQTASDDIEALRQLRLELALAEAKAGGMQDAFAAQSTLSLQVARDIKNLLPQIDLLAKGFDAVGSRSAENSAIVRKSISEIVDDIVRTEGINVELLSQDDIDTLIARAHAMKNAAVGAVNPIVQAFEDTRGQLSTILDNIAADVETANRQGVTNTGGVTPPGGPQVDEEAIKRAISHIDEASRDILRRLQHLNEDATQRVTNITARAIERLGDIFEKANEQIDKLTEDTKDRITDLFRSITERREDRDLVELFKKAQEEAFDALQKRLDREEEATSRTLDRERTERQRSTDDITRDQQRIVELVEQGEQRKQQAVERTFSIQQQANDQAFDHAQQVEERLFTRQQEIASDARDFAKRLAGAKTPQDVATLHKERTEAQETARFKQGQEAQLTQFRQKQEDKRKEFSQQNETAAITFRQGLEDKLKTFRQNNELSLSNFRRNQEDIERGIREGEEDKALGRRLNREAQLAGVRLGNEKKLQTFTDSIEDRRAQEQAGRIQADTNKQINQRIADTAKAAGEVLDTALLQVAEQEAAVDAQLRNIRDSLVDVGDALPEGTLDRFNAALAAADARSAAIRDSLRQVRDEGLLELQQRAAVGNAELILRAPPQSPVTQPTVPFQVLAAQSMIVGSLVLPPGFNTAVSQAAAAGVIFGIQQAAEGGLLNPSLIIPPGLEEPLQSISRYFRG